MKKLRLSLAVFGLVLCLGLVGSTAQAAFEPFKQACEQVDPAKRPDTCNVSNVDPVTGADGEGVLIKATNTVALVAGVAAVIAIILGGLQFILASGDSAKVGKARETIIYASIGLVIIIVARYAVAFIARRF